MMMMMIDRDREWRLPGRGSSITMSFLGGMDGI